MDNKKYNKQAVMHLLRSYAEFQKKLMKLADSGLNPFEFTEKYDEQIRVTIVLMVNPNATPSQIEVLEEDIYNHVENSIYLKHLKVSLTELLYHLENKLYNDNTLKIVE